ncbi:MAG: hypothetical protein PHS57_02525 [Alphaproteobacteria bacterium]|nr:hypothetical protein [Alphaproteobacteria bacterium]
MVKEKDQKKAGNSPKKKGGKAKFFFFMLVALFAMPFMLPTVMILVVGLAPTYVAFLTDSDPEKTGATSVGAMNVAGMVPFLIDLWLKGQTQANAIAILSSSKSWLVILGAAAIGQLIIYAVPQAIATMSLAHAETRIKALKKNLDLLKDSWGPEVATAKPISTIVPM